MTLSEFNNQLVSLEGALTRYASGLTANRENAKDLLQDTFLRALKYREQFENFSCLRAWTYTIMKNTFINNYRKESRQSTIIDHTKELVFLSHSKDIFNVEPDSICQEKEIVKAIDRLESGLRIPFKMYTQGYKYKEIAEVLGLKIGTVKSRIFFSRKRLIETLHEYN